MTDWRNRQAPSLDDVEALAREAFERLPAQFRALCGDLVIRVEEFPSDEVLRDMGLGSPFDLLGLFQGTGLAQSGTIYTGRMPNMVFLYRRPILDYWADEARHLILQPAPHGFAPLGGVSPIAV